MAVQDRILDQLERDLARHPVNSNVFFERFREEFLPSDALQTFLRQYQYFCKHFVKLLEGLLYRTPVDLLDMRIELVKTLHSELGGGQAQQAHIALLNRFAQAIGLDEAALARTVPLPSTSAYLAVLHWLFIEADYLTALGAEFAVEKTAVAEFRYLYPGLLKYEQFHDDSLEFFKLHLNEETCHADWLKQAVRRTALTPADLETVAAGAQHTADAWHAFWLGLHEAVFARSGAVTA